MWWLWKFHNSEKSRNKFIEVSLKFHEVSLLLSFMKFRKKRAMKLPTPTPGGVFQCFALISPLCFTHFTFTFFTTSGLGIDSGFRISTLYPHGPRTTDGGSSLRSIFIRNPFKMNLNKKTNAFVQSETPYNFIKEIPLRMNSNKKWYS